MHKACARNRIPSPWFCHWTSPVPGASAPSGLQPGSHSALCRPSHPSRRLSRPGASPRAPSALGIGFLAAGAGPRMGSGTHTRRPVPCPAAGGDAPACRFPQCPASTSPLWQRPRGPAASTLFLRRLCFRWNSSPAWPLLTRCQTRALQLHGPFCTYWGPGERRPLSAPLCLHSLVVRQRALP